MKNITAIYDNSYVPWKAIVFHKAVKNDSGIYQEVFDFDNSCKMINAHPLSKDETGKLAEALASAEEVDHGFLQCRGLMPENILYLNCSVGFAIWYTPPQQVCLHFVDKLKIPDGKYQIPALIWKADSNQLTVYALKGKGKPTIKSKLFHAPFFNMYECGKVCMGNVPIEVDEACDLESFMKYWQQRFFKSRFSHVIAGHLPTVTNIVQLWQSLAEAGKQFPESALRETKSTLKDLF